MRFLNSYSFFFIYRPLLFNLQKIKNKFNNYEKNFNDDNNFIK